MNTEKRNIESTNMLTQRVHFALAFRVKASQNEVEDWHFGLPDCRFKGL